MLWWNVTLPPLPPAPRQPSLEHWCFQQGNKLGRSIHSLSRCSGKLMADFTGLILQGEEYGDGSGDLKSMVLSWLPDAFLLLSLELFIWCTIINEPESRLRTKDPSGLAYLGSLFALLSLGPQNLLQLPKDDLLFSVFRITPFP